VSKLKSVKPDEFVAIMEKTIRRIAPRLFRRDLAEDEIAAIAASIKSDVDAGRNAFDIVSEQFRNLLMDPDFFCIVEEPGPLTDFTLASRLSYLLWNSTPDEQLLEVARRGKLRDSVVLREQTDRMLADPKGKRFYKGFASRNTTGRKTIYSSGRAWPRPRPSSRCSRKRMRACGSSSTRGGCLPIRCSPGITPCPRSSAAASGN
jgi:hypothetical protein